MGHADDNDVIAVDLSVEQPAEPERLLEENALLRELYKDALERIRKLEKGLLTTTSERLDPDQKQLTLGILDALFEEESASEDDDTAESGAETTSDDDVEVPAHTRRKKKPRRLPEHLPLLKLELIPEEVLALGLEHFDVIGVDVSETLEQRPSSLFRVRTERPRYLLKKRDRDRRKETIAKRQLAGISYTEFIVADPPPKPIPKSIAGPGLLAHTVVSRFQDHLPLNRLEKIYKREGLEIRRSTICQWHGKLGDLVGPLVEAMWEDARRSPILYTDATGVRVRAKKKCRNAHFWAVIAPEQHVLFAYTKNHKKQAVDRVIGAFQGKLVADAHTVYDHLYLEKLITEVGCWAHARRYFHRTLSSQPDEALVGLARINQLFRYEREWKSHKPELRKRLRQRESKPLVEKHFEWCETQLKSAIPDTPLYRALTYSLNQREALSRYLDDGRLPMHNNASEGALRRQAIGRKNWLFLGNDEAGKTNARLVSLLASCQQHDLEPRRYLLEVFCLLPVWSSDDLLALSPLKWKETRALAHVEEMLQRNPYWCAATEAELAAGDRW